MPKAQSQMPLETQDWTCSTLKFFNPYSQTVFCPSQQYAAAESSSNEPHFQAILAARLSLPGSMRAPPQADARCLEASDSVI